MEKPKYEVIVTGNATKDIIEAYNKCEHTEYIKGYVDGRIHAIVNLSYNEDSTRRSVVDFLTDHGHDPVLAADLASLIQKVLTNEFELCGRIFDKLEDKLLYHRGADLADDQTYKSN